MSKHTKKPEDEFHPLSLLRDHDVPGHLPHNGVLVPESLADALRDEEMARLRASAEAELQARLKRANEAFESASSKLDSAGESDTEAGSATHKSSGRRRGTSLQVFDPTQRRQYLASVQHLAKSSERRCTLEAALAPYANFEDGRIPLVRIRGTTLGALARLAEDMPNFAGVIDAITPMLQLQLAGDRVIRLPPLLLAGAPGIGKTYFVGRLAKVLAIHYAVVNIETSTAGWVLSGASMVWASGTPGMVFKTLGSAGHANPLILIDELDKGGQDKRYDPLSALYSLLEPHSAQRFKDESVPDMPVNASAINWMATANDLSSIPDPIRSRMQVVELPLPTNEQKVGIAKSLYANLRRDNVWGKRFAPELNERSARALAASTSVRDMRHLLVRAFAVASSAHRNHVLPGDLASAMRVTNGRIDLASVEPQGNA